jgi:hypothetical protein
MNPEAQTELQRILALDPRELTLDEKAFLQTRRSYLTKEQCLKFGVAESESVDEYAASASSDEPAVAESAKATCKARRSVA